VVRAERLGRGGGRHRRGHVRAGRECDRAGGGSTGTTAPAVETRIAGGLTRDYPWDGCLICSSTTRNRVLAGRAGTGDFYLCPCDQIDATFGQPSLIAQ
jgi:hypothetical protein